MADTSVSKRKVEVAIENGNVIRRLRDAFNEDVKTLKECISEYEKEHKVDFYSNSDDICNRLNNYNDDTKEIAEILNSFPAIRLSFLEERMVRKVRHSESDTVELTNTELFVVDNLVSEEVQEFCKKYAGRDYFIINGELGVEDFFSDLEIEKASQSRQQSIAIWMLIGAAIVGWLTFKYFEHNY